MQSRDMKRHNVRKLHKEIVSSIVEGTADAKSRAREKELLQCPVALLSYLNYKTAFDSVTTQEGSRTVAVGSYGLLKPVHDSTSEWERRTSEIVERRE